MNQTIQILRGTSANIVKHANAGESLLDGQLLYNTDKNYLTVGGGGNNSLTKHPISCRELVGYTADGSSITASKTTEYKIIAGDNTNGFVFLQNKAVSAALKNGNLILTGQPTNPSHAARIQDLSNAIAGLDSASEAVSAGCCLTGIVIENGKITARTETHSIQLSDSSKQLVGEDTRDIQTNPSDYWVNSTAIGKGSFKVAGLKLNSNALGISNHGVYSLLLGCAPWGDASGGNSHEFALCGDGALFHRHGTESTWNSWHPILTIDLIYPIGAIYITVSAEFNPNTAFYGTTWVKIEDAYLYAKLSTETAGSTYGDTDYKISTEQLPAHTHTMAHTHTGPSHTHTMNSHTHSDTFAVANYDGVTGTAMNAYSSTEARSGSFKVRGAENELGRPSIVWGATGCVSVSAQSGSAESIEVVNDNSGYSEATVSFNTTNHNHSFGHSHTLNGAVSSTTSTMQAAGTGNTGAASNSTTSSVGSGSAYKPKYLAVIVWKRTA